ncbi:olfactory receptor 7E24-like [Dipodomys spectabilis]|uniref:olfactory receptor 7E24-like n=1 Tax=Dipodomys spectabilis TaxID=105255 RepID=UPI001C53A308|nr:olfactory receptor 7E24-like [Dipodomys spectabilis]
MSEERSSSSDCPSDTEAQNLTTVSEFHLLGLSDDPKLQPVLFGLFLSMYLIAMLGNLLIILVVSSDRHLHTPMYFFLSILSLADIGFTSTTVPIMLVDIQTQSTAISYAGCLTQMSLFLFFGCMDDMLLTMMAYDRFVAICHPLHYPVRMNPRFCRILVLVSVFFSLLDSQLHNSIILQFACFKSVEIPNYFCDASQIFKLSCSDTFRNNLLIYLISVILGFVPVSGILLSYYKIISSILKIPSQSGRHKAFSTCGAHLSVVCFFYGTLLGAYCGSTVFHCSRKLVVASVMYTVVSPMLNPFIYSLRNRDIARSLKRLHSRIIKTQGLE